MIKLALPFLAVPINQNALLIMLCIFVFKESSFGPTFKVATILILNKTAIQVIPSAVSHDLILFMSLKMLFQISKNVDPLAVIPKISFTCDVTMIKATALVNPDETGPDTKSTRNPSLNIPINSSVIPATRQRNTAFCQLPPTVLKVKSAEIAVGPIATSLQLPRKI